MEFFDSLFFLEGGSFWEVLKQKLRFFDARSLQKHFKNLQFLVLAMRIVLRILEIQKVILTI